MKNPFGFLSGRPQEWGSKARKEESRQRGFRKSAQFEVVSEQLEDYLQEQDELDRIAQFEDWDRG